LIGNETPNRIMRAVTDRRVFLASLALGPMLMTDAARTGANAQSPKGRTLTGADRLAGDRFGPLAGKRIGIITNHTGRVGEALLIDLAAHATGVTLAAILTPEHGLRGTAEAGAKVAGGRDPGTGAIVHSLYGSAYKPTPAMLEGLDALIFDMQDIGARFYTYISTMGLAMQAAAQARLPFIVLDRPNPLGGEYVSGFVLGKAFSSFVGRYEIPVAHGLTVGELARMIKGERLLAGLDHLDLQVVSMQGWRRDMLWPATGGDWVATSPNIPTFETALIYPGTGFFEVTAASEGRGTEAPFLLVGHTDIDASAISDRLRAAGLAGVMFEATRFTPRSIPGVASNPRFKGRNVNGIALRIEDASACRPVEVGMHALAAFSEELARHSKIRLVPDSKAFRLAGTDRLRKALARRTPAADIIAAWQVEVAAFRERRAPYLLYAA
jgi:uncharacterized protein YbbC (DUF1343 family)